MKTVYLDKSDRWRSWLSENHEKESEIWLIFYKKETGKPSIPYEEAVEEALCFGWIDSIIKKIDEQRYARKFTPRKDNSYWSPSNKRRVKKLLSENRMTPVGLKKIEYAKKSGLWDQKQPRPDFSTGIPEDLKQALDKNSSALQHFNTLVPSQQKPFIIWITTAKRPETRKKRIEESISILEKGEKL